MHHITSMFIIGLFSLSSSIYAARGTIEVVGSSTVYPFASLAAEKFGKSTSFKTPKIEATGTGGGMKLFCQGIGEKYPDFSNASRRIKISEIEGCYQNGVNRIIEVKLGYDGIVFGHSIKSDTFGVTTRELFLALARYIPNKQGKLILNPYKKWSDINPSFPNNKITILGPPPTSGTRDSFLELVMEPGAETFSDLKTLQGLGKKQGDDQKIKNILTKFGLSHKHYTHLAQKGKAESAGKSLFIQLSHGIREDGVFIEMGENDNLIIQKLVKDKKIVGIFGFNFLDQNRHVVKGLNINGVVPAFSSIADGSYVVSRALFIYAKDAHIDIISGMHRFMNELVSSAASGNEGYLSDIGLIPAPANERAVTRLIVRNRTPLSLK